MKEQERNYFLISMCRSQECLLYAHPDENPAKHNQHAKKKKEMLVKGDVRVLTNECPTRQVQDVT